MMIVIIQEYGNQWKRSLYTLPYILLHRYETSKFPTYLIANKYANILLLPNTFWIKYKLFSAVSSLFERVYCKQIIYFYLQWKFLHFFIYFKCFTTSLFLSQGLESKSPSHNLEISSFSRYDTQVLAAASMSVLQTFSSCINATQMWVCQSSMSLVLANSKEPILCSQLSTIKQHLVQQISSLSLSMVSTDCIVLYLTAISLRKSVLSFSAQKIISQLPSRLQFCCRTYSYQEQSWSRWVSFMQLKNFWAQGQLTQEIFLHRAFISSQKISSVFLFQLYIFEWQSRVSFELFQAQSSESFVLEEKTFPIVQGNQF